MRHEEMKVMSLTHPTQDGTYKLQRGITQALLLGLNHYAIQNGLIDQDTYQKMEVSIRVGYDRTMAQISSSNARNDLE